jgi:hypothetical protein
MGGAPIFGDELYVLPLGAAMTCTCSCEVSVTASIAIE